MSVIRRCLFWPLSSTIVVLIVCFENCGMYIGKMQIVLMAQGFPLSNLEGDRAKRLLQRTEFILITLLLFICVGGKLIRQS